MVVVAVEEESFSEAFRSALADEKSSGTVAPLISYQASDKNKMEFFLGYDNTFTTKALYRQGYKWPIISERYLDSAFRSLSTLGYFDFSME